MRRRVKNEHDRGNFAGGIVNIFNFFGNLYFGGFMIISGCKIGQEVNIESIGKVKILSISFSGTTIQELRDRVKEIAGNEIRYHTKPYQISNATECEGGEGK